MLRAMREITVFFFMEDEGGWKFMGHVDALKSKDDSKSPGSDRRLQQTHRIAEPAAVVLMRNRNSSRSSEPAKPAIRPIAGQC